MKLIKINAVLVVMLLIADVSVFAQQTKKENIAVLYVGYDPSVPVDDAFINSSAGTGGYTPERFKEDFKTRFNAFEGYLKKYFTTVKAIDARSYSMDMSADYDVTIFDQRINPWEKGQPYPAYKPSRYLKEDFDFPTIFIGHTAPMMGETIGLKLDWLCLCLDADAHHIKTEHPIFKGPFPVNLTLALKPTPDGIFHYPSGKNVPKEIPMWRVQKEGYLEGKGYRVGMVSRGAGFLDSPDAEYIASGVNSKDVGAVALGRHGNFLMWGFSASPDYMTEEARQVFANSVMYIKKFKGKRPIARKYNQTIAIRSTYIDNIIASLSKESFEDYKTYIVGVNAQSQKMIKEILDKKEKGEKVSEIEEAILSAQSEPIPIVTWEEYVEQQSGNFFKPEYLKDVENFKKYLQDNKKFMYAPPEDLYGLKIDEDIKKLGIGNNDIMLLQHCVTLLKNGKQTDLANKVLLRYTGMEKSSQQWANWLNENSSKLFFTEAGGYKWLIDTTK